MTNAGVEITVANIRTTSAANDIERPMENDILKRPSLIVLVSLTLTGAAFAHSGVKNAAVKARMDGMSAIGSEMKTLGKMSKGTLAFDSAKARSAAAKIAMHAAETPGLFGPKEDDPKSEARAEIWDNFEDFTRKSKDLEVLALNLSESINLQSDLVPAVKSLGKTCQACHKPYRE